MNKKLVVLFQLVAAIVLAYAGGFKIFNPGDNFIFATLSMEPVGRYFIGFLEIFTAMMLITKDFSPLGSLLGVGVLTGAGIAHLTVLGIQVNNDGGGLFYMMIAGLASCLIVLWNKKEEIGFLGLAKK